MTTPSRPTLGLVIQMAIAAFNKHLDTQTGTQKAWGDLDQAVHGEKSGKFKIPTLLVTA